MIDTKKLTAENQSKLVNTLSQLDPAIKSAERVFDECIRASHQSLLTPEEHACLLDVMKAQRYMIIDLRFVQASINRRLELARLGFTLDPGKEE